MTSLPQPKRTKIGKGLYQYSYGDAGWVTLIHGYNGKWKWSAHRYTRFFECGDKRFGETDSRESLGEGDEYATMAEALKDGAFSLLPRDEQDALRREETARLNAETAAIVARLEEQSAKNRELLNDLVARGLYEPDPKKRAAKRRKENRDRAKRMAALGL